MRRPKDSCNYVVELVCCLVWVRTPPSRCTPAYMKCTEHQRQSARLLLFVTSYSVLIPSTLSILHTSKYHPTYTHRRSWADGMSEADVFSVETVAVYTSAVLHGTGLFVSSCLILQFKYPLLLRKQKIYCVDLSLSTCISSPRCSENLLQLTAVLKCSETEHRSQ